MTDLDPEYEGRCSQCGDPLTPRYGSFGVCANCYGTTDDDARDPLEEAYNARLLRED